MCFSPELTDDLEDQSTSRLPGHLDGDEDGRGQPDDRGSSPVANDDAVQQICPQSCQAAHWGENPQ